MKRKILVFISLLLLFAVLLTSCSGGIDTDEAKGDLLAFFDALKRDETERAEALLHPKGHSLDECISLLGRLGGADVGTGVIITEYTNFVYSYYHSDVDGSRYILVTRALLDGREFSFAVTFVKNDDGYGIYAFDEVE